MLVVKIELHSGITGKVTELAEAVIYNMGGDARVSLGNYKGKFITHKRFGNVPAETAESIVKDWPRLDRNVWELVGRCVEVAFRGKESS